MAGVFVRAETELYKIPGTLVDEMFLTKESRDIRSQSYIILYNTELHVGVVVCETCL